LLYRCNAKKRQLYLFKLVTLLKTFKRTEVQKVQVSSISTGNPWYLIYFNFLLQKHKNALVLKRRRGTPKIWQDFVKVERIGLHYREWANQRKRARFIHRKRQGRFRKQM